MISTNKKARLELWACFTFRQKDDPLNLFRFGPEWAECLDLVKNLDAVFTFGFGQLALEFAHLFRSVVAPFQFGFTFDHVSIDP
jgi:hypothetical protein